MEFKGWTQEEISFDQERVGVDSPPGMRDGASDGEESR